VRTFLISANPHVGRRKGEVLHWILQGLQWPGLDADIHEMHMQQTGVGSTTKVLCRGQCANAASLAGPTCMICLKQVQLSWKNKHLTTIYQAVFDGSLGVRVRFARFGVAIKGVV